MARWRNQFKEHNIHQALKNISQMHDQAFKVANSEARSELRRLKKIITQLQTALESIDPEIVSFAWLDDISYCLTNSTLISNFDTFISDQKLENLQEVNDNITDVVLPYLNDLRNHHKNATKTAPLRIIEDLVELESIKFTELVQVLTSDLNSMLKRKNEIETELDSLKADVRSQLTSINNIAGVSENQFNEAQKDRATHFGNAQESRKASFDAWFDEYKKESKERVESEFHTFQQLVKTSISKNRIEAATFTKLANRRLDQIDQLYGLAGNRTLSGQYLKSAVSERLEAILWSMMLIVLVGAMVLWSMHAINHGSLDGTTATEMIFSVLKITSGTIALLFGIIFSAQQARFHSANSQRMNWFGIQLETINPYIKTLPNERQHDFKENIGKRIFSDHVGSEMQVGAFRRYFGSIARHPPNMEKERGAEDQNPTP